MWGEQKDKQPLSDDIPKYRKKRGKPTPKKSKHKHEYLPVLLRYSYTQTDFSSGRPKFYTRITYGGECPICGKVNWGRSDWNKTNEEILKENPNLRIVEVQCPWGK